MSDRSDDRKFPLRRLFGNGMNVGMGWGPERCVRCGKPETNRVVLLIGDAGWHKGTLMSAGMNHDVAATLVADRWVEGVIPMLDEVRQICREAGHPEWAEDPEHPNVIDRHIPLAWRMCRGCAAKADPPLATMNSERLNAILNDGEEGGMIPHCYAQPR